MVIDPPRCSTSPCTSASPSPGSSVAAPMPESRTTRLTPPTAREKATAIEPRRPSGKAWRQAFVGDDRQRQKMAVRQQRRLATHVQPHRPPLAGAGPEGRDVLEIAAEVQRPRGCHSPADQLHGGGDIAQPIQVADALRIGDAAQADADQRLQQLVPPQQPALKFDDALSGGRGHRSPNTENPRNSYSTQNQIANEAFVGPLSDTGMVNASG